MWLNHRCRQPRMRVGAGGGSRMQREGECPLPHGSCHRDMPIGLQGGKGGIFFLAPSLLHFVLLCKAAAWWPKRRAEGCSPSAAEGPQGWGPKPEGEQLSPPHVPLLKPSCSSDWQMAEILMFKGESHAEACDVQGHAGTLKPCSPLLWIPLDQTALHTRLYSNSCLTLPMDLKRSYKEESKALISCFLWKIYPKKLVSIWCELRAQRFKYCIYK